MAQTRLRINAENVVHETVDGEVIAIDLANGSYYSLSGSGLAIWELLAAGAAEAEIGAVLAGRFEADSGAIQAAVAALLEKLLESGLVMADENATEAPPPALDDAGERAPFEPPKFERYTDMKDYFLLDPIHEVDTAGWPRPAA